MQAALTGAGAPTVAGRPAGVAGAAVAATVAEEVPGVRPVGPGDATAPRLPVTRVARVRGRGQGGTPTDVLLVRDVAETTPAAKATVAARPATGHIAGLVPVVLHTAGPAVARPVVALGPRVPTLGTGAPTPVQVAVTVAPFGTPLGAPFPVAPFRGLVPHLAAQVAVVVGTQGLEVATPLRGLAGTPRPMADRRGHPAVVEVGLLLLVPPAGLVDVVLPGKTRQAVVVTTAVAGLRETATNGRLGGLAVPPFRRAPTTLVVDEAVPDPDVGDGLLAVGHIAACLPAPPVTVV